MSHIYIYVYICIILYKLELYIYNINLIHGAFKASANIYCFKTQMELAIVGRHKYRFVVDQHLFPYTFLPVVLFVRIFSRRDKCTLVQGERVHCASSECASWHNFTYVHSATLLRSAQIISE